MRRVLIGLHKATGDQGTFGALYTNGFSCKTAELPWRENRTKISHIPVDIDYEVRIVKSPRFGKVYGLFGVPGRSHVLIHSGNFSGDVALGYQSHVEGCILLGKYHGQIKNKQGAFQNAVLVSLPTVREFMRFMNDEPFRLRMENHY